MKYAVLVLAAALFAPTVLAGSTTQTGTQSGNGWSQSTFIPVQAGTAFTLTSDTADFDIFFYDASNQLVGESIACGNDAGDVPVDAVTGEITKWDDLGAIAPCLTPVLVTFGLPATWTYTES